MKSDVKRILQKFSSNKIELSLKEAEKIVQGVKSYTKFANKYEAETKDLKGQLNRISKQLLQGISEIEQDQRKLGAAIREVDQMIKTIGSDIPQAVSGIERRRDELTSAFVSLSKAESDWKRIYTELGNVK